MEAEYFQWSTNAERYRSQATGRFVSRSAVRASLDVVLDVQAERVRALSTDLIEGNLELGAWRTAMGISLKIAHLEGAAVARGGWRQLTQSDYGWISQRIRSQLTYLQNFHDDLAYGRIPLDGVVASRAAMYVHAGRGTERAMEGRMAVDRGEELERNIGGDGASSCDECADCSDQGWVPIGSLPEVGSRQCLQNCHCYCVYRTRSQDLRDD